MRAFSTTLAAAAAVWIFSLVAAPAAKATTYYDERPGEIGVLAGAGLVDEHLVGPENNTHFNPLAGLRFAWHFTENVGLFADSTWIEYKGEPTLYGDVGEFTIRLGPEWYLNPQSNWQFLVNAGVGGMRLRSDFGGTDGRGFASVGLGVRRGWRPGALRLELRGDHTISSATELGGRDFSMVKLMAGWTFGIGAFPKDTDGDGVYDKKDKCPDTPAGAIVDAAGCPSDSDGDHVWNGIDQCPDTPAGWPVDARGCPLDTDGDGVADGKDKCPNTPKGCTVDADGCPKDGDGDKVCDGADKCPDTPAGCKVDPTGCPLDGDKDGVCDGIDKCPTSPAGAKVDEKGCTPPPPPPVFIPEGKKELVLERVYFETDKATLKPESADTLDKVAASLKNFPDVKIQIAGHTDDRGSNSHNMKLSEARAKAVMNYLIGKGVPAAQLTAQGYGENEPVGDNKTEEGRAMNRRVGLRRAN